MAGCHCSAGSLFKQGVQTTVCPLCVPYLRLHVPFVQDGSGAAAGTSQPPMGGPQKDRGLVTKWLRTYGSRPALLLLMFCLCATSQVTSARRALATGNEPVIYGALHWHVSVDHGTGWTYYVTLTHITNKGVCHFGWLRSRADLADVLVCGTLCQQFAAL